MKKILVLLIGLICVPYITFFKNIVVGKTIEVNEGVKITTQQINKDSIVLVLENNTNHPIFVASGGPDKKGMSFIPYVLWRWSNSKKKMVQSGDAFHFSPGIWTVNAFDKIKFEVFSPESSGSYYITISYFDDPEAFRIIKSKENTLDFTEEESRVLKQNRKKLRSKVICVVHRHHFNILGAKAPA